MFPMFGMPNRKVSRRDYATGMHVASLVADGGTLQLGIGSLSDAVAHCLILRHRSPEVFRAVLERLPGGTSSGRRPGLPVHVDPFRKGLYVATELLSDAAFALFREGIVNRGAGAGDDACLHAGFFLGSQALYEGLRALPEPDRRRISMRAISFVNSLYGDEAIKRRQRISASFVNEVMMVTLLGAAISDGLEDGRVVSGVGGQFDFVRMAHALDQAHSILMFGSHRPHDGSPRSNLVWKYGHTTVPRHFRDVFATEYGLAATRGLCDRDVIAALLNIADRRFQPALLAEARIAGKIERRYSLPDAAMNNAPAAIAAVLDDPTFAGHFPDYPLGTDLTEIEQRLADALTWLKGRTATGGRRLATMLGALLDGSPRRYEDALVRMALASPATLRDRMSRRLVAHALNRQSRRS
jgi:acyl-CoA hydrolase